MSLPQFGASKLKSFFGTPAGSAATTFLALTLSFTVSACSPGMLFGNNQDDGVANTKSYRKINTACAGMDMSSSTIDVKQFKKILDCFNSNHALEDLSQLVHKLSDPELQPIVSMLNQHILNNKPLLYQLEATYHALDEKKILDTTLLQLGRLLENEDFVAAGIALLREDYDGGRDGNLVGDKDLLKAIERLAGKVSEDGMKEFLDVALSLASAPAFSSIQKRMREAKPLHERALQLMTDGALNYLKFKSVVPDPLASLKPPQPFTPGRDLIDALIDGRLFRALDETLRDISSGGHDEIQYGVPQLASVMKVTLATDKDQDGHLQNALVMDGMSSLFHYLNAPIWCLKHTRYVPNGDMHVIDELSRRNSSEAGDFIKRGNLLTLTVMNPLCEYPPELERLYPAMIRFADTPAIEPATWMIKAFYRNNLGDLLVKLLSDTGYPVEGSTDVAENSGGLKYLLPALAEITERGGWDDLLYIATLPRIDQDRPKIVDILKYLVEPAPEMGGKSVYDVLFKAISKTSPGKLYDLVKSLDRFVKSDIDLLKPAMTGMREAFYVNDVHPLINLIHDIMSTASTNEEFYTTLFKIAEMPEFKGTIRMVSDMSKDGRGKELLGSLITLFHKFAQEGRTGDIHKGDAPVFVTRARHEFSSFNSPIVDAGLLPWDNGDPCRKVKLELPMDDYTAPGYKEQLDNYLSCINADHQHADVPQAMNFLRTEKTSDGRDFFDLQIDLLKSLNLTAPELDDVTERFNASIDSGKVYRLMNGLPYWISHQIHSPNEPAAASGPVLEPLMRALRPVMKDPQPVRRLLDTTAGILKRPDVPYLLKYGEDLSNLEPEPVSEPEQQGYDMARIMRWVGNKECEHNPARQLMRANEIIDDYNNAVTGWDLAADHRPPRGWTKEQFKAELEPLFQKFADPAQNAGNRNALDGTLNMLRYFTLKEGQAPNEFQHYNWDYLATWLRERSNDYTLIPYFYPGESKPRARLVNSLDRLELVLINADFQFLLPDNFGMKFLAMVGEAWGDEPRSVWPAEIKAKFPANGNKRPATIAEAYDEILKTLQTFENLIGFPELPGCHQVANPNDPPEVQHYETTDPTTALGGAPNWAIPLYVKASLFNAHQVVSIIGENLPGSGTRAAGGMKVLRDLFWEMYMSSPPEARNPRAGWKNNLSVVLKLVRMGLTRQVSRHLRDFAPHDPAMHDMFITLIEGATSTEVRPLLDALFREDPTHQLIWKVLDQIFDVFNAADGGPLTESRQKELAGKSPDEQEQVRQGWVQESERLKQLAFYSLAQAGSLGVINPALKTIGPVLHQYRDYLTAHADKVENVLRSKGASLFMRALYEDRDQSRKAMFGSLLIDVLNEPQHGLDLLAILKSIDLDPAATQAWDLFSDRSDVMTALEAYRNINLKEIGKDFLHFFEEVPGNGAAQTAVRIREYTAERLSSRQSGSKPGDTEELLRLAAEKPDGFYQILKTLSHYSENGELKDFVDLAHRSLLKPQP